MHKSGKGTHAAKDITAGGTTCQYRFNVGQFKGFSESVGPFQSAEFGGRLCGSIPRSGSSESLIGLGDSSFKSGSPLRGISEEARGALLRFSHIALSKTIMRTCAKLYPKDTKYGVVLWFIYGRTCWCSHSEDISEYNTLICCLQYQQYKF